ncbi:hypothetical protein FACS1894120_5820 [Clostridia bacterium]|nr:hypothetical protein FACS1894120_5820 [Clostridia bacterium]
MEATVKGSMAAPAERITADYWKTHAKPSDISKRDHAAKRERDKRVALVCGVVCLACVLSVAIAEIFFPVRSINADQSYVIIDGEYYPLDIPSK